MLRFREQQGYNPQGMAPVYMYGGSNMPQMPQSGPMYNAQAQQPWNQNFCPPQQAAYTMPPQCQQQLMPPQRQMQPMQPQMQPQMQPMQQQQQQQIVPVPVAAIVPSDRKSKPKVVRVASPVQETTECSPASSADESLEDCHVCGNNLGHKAGRYSMDCRCVQKPCKHRLVCNACGVFFADETVKRRNNPVRAQMAVHTHKDKLKVHCQACSNERYARCLESHMRPSRVGKRKKRSPKAKCPGHKVKPQKPKGRRDSLTQLSDSYIDILKMESLNVQSDRETDHHTDSDSDGHDDAVTQDVMTQDVMTQDVTQDSKPSMVPSLFGGLDLLLNAAAELESKSG